MLQIARALGLGVRFLILFANLRYPLLGLARMLTAAIAT
jgi:hypothetical protein